MKVVDANVLIYAVNSAAPQHQVASAGANPGPRHAEILGNVVRPIGTGGNLTTDAHLAAIAIEYGAELWSFDTDFRRFTGLVFRPLGI